MTSDSGEKPMITGSILRSENLSSIANLIRKMSTETGTLSALDTSALLDRVLDALGWDALDPNSVSRRGDPGADRIHVVLSAGRKPRIQLLLLPLGRRLSETFPDLPDDGAKAEWVAITNLHEWILWRRQDPTAPFRSIVMRSGPGGKELAAFFGKEAHLSGDINSLWIDRTLGAEIASILRKHLAGSKELIAVLRRALRVEKGRTASVRDIEAALSRMVIEINTGANRRTPAFQQDSGDHLVAQLLRPANRAPDGTDLPSAGVEVPRRTTAPSVDEWPESATHILHRKGYSSFINYNPRSGRTVLLPGSVMRRRTKSSFPPHHAGLREEALRAGAFVEEGQTLRVVHPFPVDTPSTAATLVSGTVSNGWTSWRNPEGVLIRRPHPPTRGARRARRVTAADETVLAPNTNEAPLANTGEEDTALQ